MENFRAADAASFERITASFAHWDDIDVHVRGRVITSGGHGFAGIARRKLLNILQERCAELDVDVRFETDLTSDADLARLGLGDADVVVAADGINSLLRAKYADVFQPEIDWGRCKFCWLGTDKPLDAFTFVFRETPHGVFQVHAYPFERGARPRSTWIVECREDVWRRAGLEDADEARTVRFVSELFADHLAGHRVLVNRSIWRSFPTVRCERWHHRNIVLIGDAAHTAHFSIGSGTKLAMEDAIGLAEAFRVHGIADVPRALAAYEEARKPVCLRTQRAARTSLEWFEESARAMRQEPLQFTFNLMTRSRQITYDNLARRDPALVESATRWWNAEEGATAVTTSGKPRPPMFAPLRLRGLELENRVVVSPMCQYSASDGIAGEWHLVHLGARAIGGAGLVIAEMTNVAADARITLGCTGIWNEAHALAWKRIVDFVHAHSGARIGLQLGHAGRKGSCNLPWEGDDPLRDSRAWTTLGPSALPFDDAHAARDGSPDMERVRAQYVHAAELALAAGFDLPDPHGARLSLEASSRRLQPPPRCLADLGRRCFSRS
jgi:anthraniloyl-CoA monooxygenase